MQVLTASSIALLLSNFFCFRIFHIQQPVRRLVLLDLREAVRLLIKPIVVFIVVAHGNLSQEHRAGPRSHLKIVIVVEVGIDRDALPGVQLDLGPRRDEKGPAVLEGLDVGAPKASSGVEQ